MSTRMSGSRAVGDKSSGSGFRGNLLHADHIWYPMV